MTEKRITAHDSEDDYLTVHTLTLHRAATKVRKGSRQEAFNDANAAIRAEIDYFREPNPAPIPSPDELRVLDEDLSANYLSRARVFYGDEQFSIKLGMMAGLYSQLAYDEISRKILEGIGSAEPAERMEVTRLFVHVMCTHGPDSERGRAMIQLIQILHAKNGVSPGQHPREFYQVIYSFVKYPMLFMRMYGPRPNPKNELAWFYLWRRVGECFGMHNLPETFEEFMERGEQWEDEQFARQKTLLAGSDAVERRAVRGGIVGMKFKTPGAEVVHGLVQMFADRAVHALTADRPDDGFFTSIRKRVMRAFLQIPYTERLVRFICTQVASAVPRELRDVLDIDRHPIVGVVIAQTMLHARRPLVPLLSEQWKKFPFQKRPVPKQRTVSEQAVAQLKRVQDMLVRAVETMAILENATLPVTVLTVGGQRQDIASAEQLAAFLLSYARDILLRIPHKYRVFVNGHVHQVDELFEALGKSKNSRPAAWRRAFLRVLGALGNNLDAVEEITDEPEHEIR